MDAALRQVGGVSALRGGAPARAPWFSLARILALAALWLSSGAAATAVVPVPVPVQVQVQEPEPSTARQWLERSSALVEKAPFFLRYRVELTLTVADQTTHVAGTGGVLFADSERLRLEIETKVTVCPASQSHECGLAGSLTPAISQSMTMDTRVVFDGSHSWTATSLQGARPAEVFKVPLDRLGELSRQQGVGFVSRDPVSLWSAFREHVDFELVRVERRPGAQGAPNQGAPNGGFVILEGRRSEELRRELGPSFDVFGDEAIVRVVLDRETGYPGLLSIGPDADRGLRITTTAVDFLDAAEVGAEDFTFVPPAGARVVELPVQGQE